MTTLWLNINRSLLRLVLLLSDIMKKIVFPSFPDEHNEICKYQKTNNPQEDKIQPQKCDPL